MNGTGIHALKKDELEKKPDRDVDVLTEDDDTMRGNKLVCAACGHPITSDSQRRIVEGQHQHARINPHGYEHRFACFRSAAGCISVGQVSQYYSWFSGYGWQMAHCGGCGMHMGWQFHGEHDRFFGLLVRVLVESEAS